MFNSIGTYYAGIILGLESRGLPRAVNRLRTYLVAGYYASH